MIILLYEWLMIMVLAQPISVGLTNAYDSIITLGNVNNLAV